MVKGIKKYLGLLASSLMLMSIAGLFSQAAQAELVHPKADRAPAAADHASDQADQRVVNIKWNALSTLVGYLSGSVNVKVSQPITVGIRAGSFMYGEDGTDKDDRAPQFGDIWDIAATMSYAFNHHVMQSGWLVSPYVGFARAKYTAIIDDTKRTEHSISVGVPFMYQWMWNSGFNIQLGIGPSYSDVRQGSASLKGVGLTGGFTIGGAF